MRLIVHRGTHQIGGSCVELESGGNKLILDLGLPLTNPDGSRFQMSGRDRDVRSLVAQSVLPNVRDLYEDDDGSICGLIISHAHQDHYGLANFVKPHVLVYASEGTKALMNVSQVFLPGLALMPEISVMPKQQTIEIGPFAVTAYLVDHAAPDALMLLVEAEGKRVLYSGDLRAHGRKSVLFERFVENPPPDIDFLLLEGTMINRTNQEFPTEQSVEEALAQVFRSQRNLTYVACSSQNLDRIVSIYRASRKAGSTMVIDPYTAFVLDQLQCISTHIPQYSWDGVRTWCWYPHMDILTRAGFSGFAAKLKSRSIEFRDLLRDRADLVMLVRSNYLLRKIPAKLPSTAGMLLIWSMWDGYLTGTDYASRFCEEYDVPIRHIHTSGHATVPDLQRLAAAVKPRLLIPIHTFEPEKFAGKFENLRPASDGESIEI